MYEEGKGVPQNPVEAGRWYRQAADQGNTIARSKLDLDHPWGNGAPNDYMWLNLPKADIPQSPARVGMIAWRRGPAIASLGSLGTVDVPKDFVFAEAEGAKKFVEAIGNVPTGQEFGVLAPASLEWFVLYKFYGTGYIRDDRRTGLDSGGVLAAIRVAVKESNEMRARRGDGPLTVAGWVSPPRYDETTHCLEWSVKAQNAAGSTFTESDKIYLGRKGFLKASLVVREDQFAGALPHARPALDGFAYADENNYQALAEGDQVAKYGLADLTEASGYSKKGQLGPTDIPIALLLVLACSGILLLIKKLSSQEQSPD
jgi:uncharacterized membrane-anchored protein